jgi:hypothetical protein
MILIPDWLLAKCELMIAFNLIAWGTYSLGRFLFELMSAWTMVFKFIIRRKARND